jgi:hypothetical protein
MLLTLRTTDLGHFHDWNTGVDNYKIVCLIFVTFSMKLSPLITFNCSKCLEYFEMEIFGDNYKMPS